MHEYAKQIMCTVKSKVEAKGIDNLSLQDAEEFKCWTEIAKNIVCFDKDYKIVEAMEKSEDEEEVMEKIAMYTDYPTKHYNGNRFMNGKFAGSGVGNRTAHYQPMYHYYRDYENGYDTDYDEHERMHYSSFNPTVPTHGNVNTSRMETARRHYEERKQVKDDSLDGKRKNVDALKEFADAFKDFVMSYSNTMDATEKSTIKQTMQSVINEI